MDVLCFDIGSSGVRGARFNERLEISSVHDSPWNLHRDAEGRATLSVYDIECAFADVAQTLAAPAPAAISAGCFMHSFLVMSSCCAALTPVFTWLDTSRPEGVDIVRRRIGNAFHERTGCHYYPMFPVFKLAANPPGRGNRVGSPKTWLAWELTGAFVEDCGMASASGMADVRADVWDSELAQISRIDLEDLPQIVDPDAVVGEVHEAGSARFGIPAGTKFVAGSGDGFLANVGSGCTTSRRISITLGTSGVARQMVPQPVLDTTAGTFCYRARSDAFLLGCASNNGGNALDWGRIAFGPMATDIPSNVNLPIFLPFMNGERSLEWDAGLKESWHGRRDTHTPAQLSRAVVEGVLFNIAQYVEVVERESGVAAQDIVLSGNAFQDPLLAPMLASLLGRELVKPEFAGYATLRGAAVYAWRALGHDVAPLLEKEVMGSERIKSMLDPSLNDRFMEFKQLRQHVVRSSL